MQAHSLQRFPANCFVSRQMKYLQLSVIVLVNLVSLLANEVEYRSDRDFQPCFPLQKLTGILDRALDSAIFSVAVQSSQPELDIHAVYLRYFWLADTHLISVFVSVQRMWSTSKLASIHPC